MTRLMIVDDSNIIRRKIERDLQLPQVQLVGTASNGVEALELFQQLAPDAVTMDITMPEMDGIQCVEAMMKLKADIRILVISALADKATALEAIRKGARGFLCKPFSTEALNEALAELLE